MHCTCGPHPRIDLTAAVSHPASSSDEESEALASCRRKVRDACRSHGCFHVAIDLPAAAPHSFSGNASVLKSLAKPRERIERDIESLFAPEFFEGGVKRCAGDAAPLSDEGGSGGGACSEFEEICNGGLIEVPFPSKCIPAADDHAPIANDRVESATTATFRGRIAESGDEKQPTPEPKLSWEFRRCLGSYALQSSDEADVDRNESCKADNTQSSNDAPEDDTWGLLPTWTNTLHSIASMIIQLLGIPPQLALQEKHCRCLNTNGIASTQRCRCCNIDLLRVFRYDALPPSQTNDERTMGSSAHSDWGTLTVVWQDAKGGLQTYCHACYAWSDVDASDHPTVSTPSTTAMDGGECHTIQLFVHVGDFLSLASMEEGKNGNAPLPTWPSPKHRVLCPTKREGSASAADSCRRSLVYFAYPPPGISLDVAREVVASLAASRSSIDSTTNSSVGSATAYDCYSLLHNQSQQSPSKEKGGDGVETKLSASFQTQERIKSVAFDEVIFDKWNQVQRKTA